MYPQVLLLGNGLYRSYGEDSWKEFLDSISQRTDLQGDLDTDYKAPMFLKSQLITKRGIKSALEKTDKKFFGTLENDDLRKTLRILLSTGFDDIITTNYDYRLEIAATQKETITKSFLDNHAHNIEEGKRVEPKYLIKSYQSIDYSGVNNRIWHVHGESKKQDSMILSLNYYSRLLARIIKCSEEAKNRYVSSQKKSVTPAIKSWIDSFILGDVYVLGFGFDYSEIDLWWLLERKSNEKANHGKLYFYEPVSNHVSEYNEKCQLLKLFGAKPDNLGYDVSGKSENEKKKIYSDFYLKAIDSIRQEVEKNKKAEAGK